MLGFIVALCTRTKAGLLTVDILVIANPDVEFSEAFLIRVVQDMIHLHVQAASGYMKMPDSQLPALLNRKINSYLHELLSCTVLPKRIIHSKINYVFSRYYYLMNYEEINVFQKFLLKLVIQYGIFARRILYKI